MKHNITKTLFRTILPKNLNLFITTSKNQLLNKKIMSLFGFNSSSFHTLTTCPSFHFCQSTPTKKTPLSAQQIPEENLQVAITQSKLQDQQVQVFHTKGTLSILDKVPGPKNPQTGQLYVLMFTCGQCNAKQIKSFTKNAYHKGVVLARCVGCDKVHLVADNLGWFEDQPTNVETLHEGKVKKVHDQGAINAFLKKAFEEEGELFGKGGEEREKHKEGEKLKEGESKQTVKEETKEAKQEKKQ